MSSPAPYPAPVMQPTPPKFDFAQRPLLVIWEVTQACDLACVHCRASAQPLRDPRELSFDQAKALIDEIARMQVPLFVLTGGDPMKRPDIYDIVEYSAARGVHTAMTPSATPLLTREAIFELKRRGLRRFAVSLDGSSAQIHDDFRRVPGSFQRTLDAIQWANEARLPVQINTTVARHNLADLDRIIALLEEQKIVLWSVFFLVPTGRGQTDQMLSPEECEQVFAKLYDASQRVRFHIKTTEAPHYRRFVVQQKAGARPALDSSAAAPFDFGNGRPGVNDGKGFVFVSHQGDVFPSGFFPLAAGNALTQPLHQIYRESPLFLSLRDPDQLRGKCGGCDFRELCGGSRARAYALTGDPLASDPSCLYEPDRTNNSSRTVTPSEDVSPSRGATPCS